MRQMPQHAALIAPIYGELLAAQGDHESALRAFQLAADGAPSGVLEARAIFSLLRLGRGLLLAQRLESALHRYCVEPKGLLVRAAHLAVNDAQLGAAGWVGISPELDLLGELVGDHAAGRISVTDVEGRFRYEVRILGTGSNAFRIDRRQLTDGVHGASSGGAHTAAVSPGNAPSSALLVHVDGHPLIGSGLSWPPQFRLDGRASLEGRWISGWCSLGWNAKFPRSLRLSDELGATASLRTYPDPVNPGKWRFEADLAKAGLLGRHINVAAVLPDGRTELLPDAPLLRQPGRRPGPQRPGNITVAAGRARPPRRLSALQPQLDVIVPVYRGYDETLACIDSVLRTLPGWASLVVVDDASPEPRLAAALDRLAAERRIQLLRNARNLGFPGAVNAGLAAHPDRDVLVLNSDAMVFGPWLERLRSAAYSRPDIGSVTPLSNDGTIVSYPPGAARRYTAEEAAELDGIARSINRGQTVQIPVGVGFCLYLRRDCLQAVGNLDAETFDKGYGEETDLCMRAHLRGWKHLAAADVFVLHAGGKSFGNRRQALLERSGRLIELRYPGYDASIARYIQADPLAPMRRRLDEARLKHSAQRFVLLITIRPTGGVDRFLLEHCRKIRSQGMTPLILMPVAGKVPRCRLWTDGVAVSDLVYEIPDELPGLRGMLRRLDIDRVEIHHFLGLDGRVIEALRKLGLPYDVFIHDYIWMCPRVTLIDGSGKYCGEPPVARCEACVRKNGSRLSETISVARLRRRSARWLEGAQRIVAPSLDTAQRYQRHFPRLVVAVEPWETGVVPAAQAPPAAGPVRVVLIGGIGEHKGYRILLQCARDAATRGLPLEFVVIGETANDERLLKTGKAFITGRYQESEMVALLQRERPHIALFASVWPETWCYALSHAIRAGLPIVGFDLGAVAERLRPLPSALLLPLDIRPRDLNRQLLDHARAHGGEPQPQRKPPAIGPKRAGNYDTIDDVPPVADAKNRSIRSSNEMVSKRQLGTKQAQQLPAAEPKEVAAEPKPTATAQVMVLPPGRYAFSVTANKPAEGSLGSGLPPPAMQVSAGPGLPVGQIEFLSGPRGPGGWLSSLGDTLIARVNSGGGAFVLTSIRTPGGSTLSMDVRRMEEHEAVPALAPQGSAASAQQASLRLQISTHQRNRGDLVFTGQPWAGRAGKGLWIEGFSVTPLEGIGAQDIEYKALTASGFETPWLSDGAYCGTRGMSVPLVGFSVRLKPGPATAQYECEYSGAFQSGVITAPLRNGAPCRSSAANDPLEGIQVRIVVARAPAEKVDAPRTPSPSATPVRGSGPRFSKFREEEPQPVAQPVKGSPVKGGAPAAAAQPQPRPKDGRPAAAKKAAAAKKRA